MKILVSGAAGVQGRSALVYLLHQDDVVEVLATDIREDTLNDIKTQITDERLKVQRLDLSDYDATVKTFREYDVVLNCALTLGGYAKTTKAAAVAGVNYTDMTTKGEREAQRAMDQDYKARGLVCLQDMGVAPGCSNIMAAYLMGKLDRTDTIDFKMITIDLVPTEDHTVPLHCPIPLSDLLYLYSKPTYIYEDGVFKEIEPRARPERFVFDDPIGPQTIAGVAHSEPVCLSRSFSDRGIKRITTKTSYGSDIDRKIEFLRDLGFGNREPIDIGGQKIVPFDVLQAIVNQLPPEKGTPPNFIADLVTVVRGEKDGVDAEYRMRAVIPQGLHKKMREGGCQGSYRAGICAAAAAVMIGRGQIKMLGVVEPEVAVPPEQYFKNLVDFGYHIELTETLKTKLAYGGTASRL